MSPLSTPDNFAPNAPRADRDDCVDPAPRAGAAPRGGRRVLAGATITLAAAAIELYGSRQGRSLFLVADAVHLLAHMAIYGALLVRPSRSGRDVASVAVLAIVLLIAPGIVLSATSDLVRGPEPVAARTLLLSLAGLAANLATAWLLRSGARVRQSFQVAVVHELSDGALSIVALLGALLIALRGWTFVDPVLSLGLGAWLLGWAGAGLRRALSSNA